jgi:hypothetical protein
MVMLPWLEPTDLLVPFWPVINFPFGVRKLPFGILAILSSHSPQIARTTIFSIQFFSLSYVWPAEHQD